MIPEDATAPGALNILLAEAGLEKLDESQIARFDLYLELILKWNSRFNLTAIRDREGILRRHFVESIACAHALPPRVKSVLDMGSGAGFPGIPIAICRPDLAVMLAESQIKKAGFLNEAVRTLELKASVFSGRAESIRITFDCVALRAVDHMKSAIEAAIPLLNREGWLVVMTTEPCLPETIAAGGTQIGWEVPRNLPGSSHGIILAGSIK